MPEHLAVRSFAYQIAKIMNGSMPAVIQVGNLKSTRDFIDIDDVTEIFLKLVHNPAAYGEVVNVCCGKAIMIEDILLRLIDFSGKKIEIRPNSSRLKQVDVPEHYGSVEKLKDIIGQAPYMDIDRTLKRILEDMRETP